MILEKDAANISLRYIANAFVLCKHNVKIYATYMTAQISEYFSNATKILSVNELSQDDIDWCDIIFCPFHIFS